MPVVANHIGQRLRRHHQAQGSRSRWGRECIRSLIAQHLFCRRSAFRTPIPAHEHIPPHRSLWTASALIHHSAVALMRSLSGHDVGPGTGAGVYEPHLLQLPQRLLVQVTPLALPVRAVAAPYPRPFVPLQPQPQQVVHERFGILGMRALGVEILYAQQPLPALALGRKPRHERGKHIAQVHAASGRGSKASLHRRLQPIGLKCILCFFHCSKKPLRGGHLRYPAKHACCLAI